MYHQRLRPAFLGIFAGVVIDVCFCGPKREVAVRQFEVTFGRSRGRFVQAILITPIHLLGPASPSMPIDAKRNSRSLRPIPMVFPSDPLQFPDRRPQIPCPPASGILKQPFDSMLEFSTYWSLVAAGPRRHPCKVPCGQGMDLRHAFWPTLFAQSGLPEPSSKP